MFRFEKKEKYMSDLIIKDVCYPRKYKDKNGDDKTNWIKIGTSFERDGKQNIELYTIPVDLKDGKLQVSCFEKRNFNETPF